MAAQPVEHGAVPLDAVRAFQHPVVLVGEDEELRGDAAALERGESRKPLAVGDTEILLAGDDQHRGRPFRDMIDRAPFLGVGAFPPRAAMLPFVRSEEPRVGKECISTWTYRWTAYHKTKTTQTK